MPSWLFCLRKNWRLLILDSAVFINFDLGYYVNSNSFFLILILKKNIVFKELFYPESNFYNNNLVLS
jgi:hypothetical protein